MPVKSCAARELNRRSFIRPHHCGHHRWHRRCRRHHLQCPHRPRRYRHHRRSCLRLHCRNRHPCCRHRRKPRLHRCFHQLASFLCPFLVSLCVFSRVLFCVW